jgi:hypothetical protein
MENTAGIQKRTVVYYLNSIISIALMFGFQHLPVIQPLTPLGMSIVGIFLGVIYGWSTVGIIWPALLGLIALGFSGYTTVPDAFQSGYGGDTYLFVFFILIFAAIIDKAGVTDVIANWVVSRKIARGKPWVLTILLLTAAYIVAALVSVTPSIIICWGILYKLCQIFGFTNKDKYPKLMVIGIVFAALMGHSAFPFKAMAVILMGVFTKQTGISVNFVTFTILAVVIGYSAVWGYIFLCRFVFKPDVSPIINSNAVFENKTSLNSYQKQVMLLLAALIFFLFLPGILSDKIWLVAFLNKLGNTGIVVILLAFAVFIRKKDYSQFVNFIDLIRTGVPWQNLFLLSTALPLATAMTSKDTGVKEFFVSILNPLLNGYGGPVLFVALILTCSIIMTNFMGDVIVGLIMMPLVCSYAPVVGANSEMLAVALCVTCNMAIILPSASPLAALLHGNTEWVDARDIYKHSIPTILVSILIVLVICLTVGNILL